MEKKHNWYECIEEPFRGLVYELRNSGFNTVASCAHNPHPYIEMEWYDNDEPEKLWNLLTELSYRRWNISAIWGDSGGRHLRIDFFPVDAGIKKGMMKLEDVK